MPIRKAKNSKGILKKGKFLSLQEVADIVDVHKETIRDWIKGSEVKVDIYTAKRNLWVVRAVDVVKFNDSIDKAKNSEGMRKKGKFLPLQFVADIVGVHKETIRDWINKGKVQVDIYTAERGLWVVRATDLDKFLDYEEKKRKRQSAE